MLHEERCQWGYQIKSIYHFPVGQCYLSILTDKQSWRKAPVHESCGVNVLFARRHCFVLLMLLLIKKYISTLISTLLSLCIADYYWLSRPTSSKSYIVKARSEVGRCSINRGGHLVFSCWSRSCPMLCLASNLIFLDIQNLVVGCFCGLNRLLILCPGGARPCVYSVAMPQPATDILPPMIL